MKFSSKFLAREILKSIPGKRIEIICREKNNNFLKKYNLKRKDVYNIVNNLNVNCFVERRENYDTRIKAKYLYIFNPLISLTDIYGTVLDHVYVKICELNNNILVVSIHQHDD